MSHSIRTAARASVFGRFLGGFEQRLGIAVFALALLFAGAQAACTGMKALATLEPYRLQDLHAKLH